VTVLGKGHSKGWINSKKALLPDANLEDNFLIPFSQLPLEEGDYLPIFSMPQYKF
jgi:hypothetical protein